MVYARRPVAVLGFAGFVADLLGCAVLNPAYGSDRVFCLAWVDALLLWVAIVYILIGGCNESR